MNISEKAFQHPNAKADARFIEDALAELEECISYIESAHNVYLIGDRRDFDRARIDWIGLSRIQVASLLNTWRTGIIRKYKIRPPVQTPIAHPKVGRNDLCPCGSGRKYKKCCLNKHREPISAPQPSGYLESVHPITGDPMWHFKVLGVDALNLIEMFLQKYPHEGYSLSIFNTMTNKAEVEVLDISIGEMKHIIDRIYTIEHAAPIAWVGVNSLSESYVVAMPLTKGVFRGVYRLHDGKLTSTNIDADSTRCD